MQGGWDYRTLVAAIRRRGVHVSVISSIRTQPALISDGLRRQEGRFAELAERQSVIARPIREQDGACEPAAELIRLRQNA